MTILKGFFVIKVDLNTLLRVGAGEVSGFFS